MPGSAPSERYANITASREFFGPRATSWEQRFPDDDPEYAKAVAELALAPGDVVVDVACGTGRAIPWLRAAVGPTGTVVGVDVTVEMLGEAARRGRAELGALVLADAMRLPFADESHDAVFAAGLLPHLPDPITGLRELARICRLGAHLALFHPLGRSALARRRGHEPDPADIRSEARIRSALGTAGWSCEVVDDAEERYFVLATRQ
jgi:SAM-dependent methyltransferase